MPRYRRGRGRCPRWVARLPYADFFKPAGIPLMNLEITTLLIEEFEALRLVDSEGLEQGEAARRMGVSTKTLWNDLKSARKKIADALAYGRGIQIQGGSYRIQKR